MALDISAPAILIALSILAWIAVLPRFFFRAGEWNLQWWLNTAPFGATGVVLLGALGGGVVPVVAPTQWLGATMALTGTVILVAAASLMSYTLGTHRRPLALWMQNDDAPEHLVTEGPYALVRHPFYSSYILLLTGCVLAVPHWLNLALLLFIAYRLNATAAREEARFLKSSFGEAYAEYMSRTRRFVPVGRG